MIEMCRPLSWSLGLVLGVLSYNFVRGVSQLLLKQSLPGQELLPLGLRTRMLQCEGYMSISWTLPAI